MGERRILRVWDRKPSRESRVNRDHPFAQGLRYFVLIDRYGVARNLAGEQLTFTSDAGFVLENDFAYSYSGSGQGQFTLTKPSWVGSYAVSYRPVDTTVHWMFSSSTAWDGLYAQNTNNLILTSNSGFAGSVTPSGQTFNGYYRVAISLPAANDFRAVSGTGAVAVDTSAALPVGTLDRLVLGGDYSQSNGSTSDFQYFAIWDQPLPDYGLQAFNENPYALIEPVAGRKFFLPSAGGGGATITPTGLSSSAFGSFSVNAGDRILTFTGKASDEAFGVFNLRARNKILLTGKSSNEAFGSFNVYPGKVILLPNSKTSDNAIGSSSLLSGQKLINPVAKTTDNAFGSFIIVSGDRILLINGIASSEAFGAFSVNNNTATQNVLPSGYFDSAFGSFSLRPDQYIIFEGKEYLEFGQFLLSGSAVVRAMHFFDWVSQQPGLRGSMNDKLYQYLRDHGFTGSTPTMLFLWLRSLGYVGNTATMLTAFERDYTTRWH